MKGSRIYTIKGGKFTSTTGFIVPYAIPGRRAGFGRLSGSLAP